MGLPPQERNSVVLEKDVGNTCRINLHGATVTSWKVDGIEQLFVSSKAVFDEKSPIRGGIPIAFPKFGPWDDKPLHGFARIRKWRPTGEVETLSNGSLKAKFELDDDEYTRSLWNHRFRLVYTVTLGEKSLKTKVTVTNPSEDEPFSFELLLHTYLRVDDARTCSVVGLKGSSFVTKRDEDVATTDDAPVTIDGAITRLYAETSPIHELVALEKTVSMIKCNFPDTVLWNPGQETAKTIPDLADDEFSRFVCVEPGSFFSPVTLPPKSSFEASQSLKIM